MSHKLLTQRAIFCIGVNARKGILSQNFVKHVVPPKTALALVPWLFVWSIKLFLA